MAMVEEATIIVTGASRFEVTARAGWQMKRAEQAGWIVSTVTYEKVKSIGVPDWRALIEVEKHRLKEFRVTAGKPREAKLWYPEFKQGEWILAPTKEDAQALIDERCLEAQTYLDPAFDEHGPRVVGEEG